MLTCTDVTEIVTDYLEGRMPFWRRMSFLLHVAMCPPCRRYLRQMRLTIRTLGALPDQPMPDDVRDELLRHLRGR